MKLAEFKPMIDLLGDPHRADLRGDVRTDFAGEDQRHHRRREFEDKDLAGGQTGGIARNQRRNDVDCHLDADDGADKEGYDDNERNRIDAEFINLVDETFEKLAPFLRNAEHLSHKEAIAAE